MRDRHIFPNSLFNCQRTCYLAAGGRYCLMANLLSTTFSFFWSVRKTCFPSEQENVYDRILSVCQQFLLTFLKKFCCSLTAVSAAGSSPFLIPFTRKMERLFHSARGETMQSVSYCQVPFLILFYPLALIFQSDISKRFLRSVRWKTFMWSPYCKIRC